MNDDFAALLDLREVAPDRFETVPVGEGHLFGGYTSALALRAAAATVAPELRPHSLHAYFLDPGRAGVPTTIEVLRWRDGRSFAVRHVTVAQGGGVPLQFTASFHLGEDGPDQHVAAAEAPIPPEDLVEDASLLGSIDPVEFRLLGGPREDLPGRPMQRMHPYWARLRRPLADDPVLHACAVAFVTDYMVVSSSLSPGEPAAPGSLALTIDHAVWFHRPAVADDWLLYSADPTSTAGGRALSHGAVRDRSGRLVASFAQEALHRPPRPR